VQPVKAPGSASPALQKLRLLLAEDSPANQMVEKVGYIITRKVAYTLLFANVPEITCKNLKLVNFISDRVKHSD
jgi:hypothetical protein